jgi:hypothetical protein
MSEEALRLCDFETQADVQAWSVNSGRPRLSDQHVTHGKSSLEIVFDPAGQYHPAYMTWNRPRRDWSGYDALVLDVLNPSDEPMPGFLLIADQAWKDKNASYWNRHNSSTVFAPGRTTWTIPLGGLYRGEAGSRNNDIKRNIDTASIVRLDFGFGRKGASGSVFIDDMRLVKVARPAGVWAFDFGPPDQSVMLGWTGVSHKDAYAKKAGFGWGPAGGAPWDGAARDTTFGPPLIRDFCEAGGYRFRIDVPAGEYAVTLIYENSGYWGGEQSQHTTRSVAVDGKTVWSEARPDGAAATLFRFEDVEPIGADVWDTYMKAELARPVRFKVTAASDGLTLQFQSDHRWGSKLAGMVIHKADDAAAAKWTQDQLEQLAAQFRQQAVCLDKPAKATPLPDAWKALQLVAWPVPLEQDVTPHSLPPAGATPPEKLALSAVAARGETATLCLAVRPWEQLGEAKLAFSWTGGPAKLPVEINRVWYATSRGFNSIAYRIGPHTLRPADALPMTKDVTRELIVKVRVPADAAPGDYRGELTIVRDGGKLAVPVALRVSPVVLSRQTDFRMGFYGLGPPRMAGAQQQRQWLEQTLAMLREYGMNMVSDGPDIALKGWRGGEPMLDFAAMDEFVVLLRKHGFDGPINGYGGPRVSGLHQGYEKGQVADTVAKQSGLAYEDAFMKVWAEIDRHARQNNWPVIWYAMCDETRVREVAQRELEFMKLMAKASAAFPRTVRTSGSYSVGFAKRPTDPADMLYWHQRFFEVLDISDLNSHDEGVLAEAAKLGREVHIYNQGTSRYSFGLYQWNEFRRGVKARTQWHLNILHGYQFFDLDGREPDSAMICYGRERIHPTIEFERCRAGAHDFYLYQMLERAASRGDSPGAKDAAALLESLTAGMKLNQRRPPEGFDAEAVKHRVLAALEAEQAPQQKRGGS